MTDASLVWRREQGTPGGVGEPEDPVLSEDEELVAFAYFTFSGALVFRVCLDGRVLGPEGEELRGAALREAASVAQHALVHTKFWSATSAAVLSLVQRAAFAEAQEEGGG